MSFDTPAKAKQIFEKYKFRPIRRLGQNFLIDKNIIEKIINAANLCAEDYVLEIGPGLGAVTDRLSKKVKKVLAVEVDKKLHNILSEEFTWPNVELLSANILKVPNKEICLRLGSGQYNIVSNLPYHITSPILEKFLTELPKPDFMILMMQKEVGERIAAEPPHMNLLALAVKFYAEATRLFTVSKNSFWPVPRVDSVVMNIVPKSTDEVNQLIEKQKIHFFWTLVKMGFRSKRKYLISNLEHHAAIPKNKLIQAFHELGWGKQVRAENLSLEDWLKLAKIL